ncbi:MAG: hypothetical protein ABSC90_06395 [Acidimicrobiales bacterium]|jgi:hypothetical protein
MTKAEHLDEPALIASAVHGPSGAEGPTHLAHCPTCREELETWRRISAVTRGAMASTVLAGEERADGMLLRLGTRAEVVSTPNERPTAVRDRARSRRWQWLVAAVGVVTAAVVAITLTLGPSAPSQALVLERIRGTPVIAARWKTMHTTASLVLTAPQGYVASSFRTVGALSPGTNAFTFTTSLVNPGGLGSKATYLSDGSLVYLPCDPGFRQVGRRPCIAYPAQHGTSAGISLAFLRDVRGPVTSLGQRDIGGVPTTGYRLSVPVDAYAAGALPSERALVRSSLATTDIIRIEVWIDDRGLPRQLDTSYLERQPQLPTLLRVTNREQITYSQARLHVVVPNRNDVVVAPDLDAAIQLTNTYEREVEALHTNLSS